MNKRLLSLLLALLMLVSLIPTAAFAAVRGGDEIPAEAPAADEDAAALHAELPAVEGEDLAAELAADDTPDGNLCRPSDNASVTATARSVEGSHTADLAIDGDSTTRWTSSDGADRGSKTDEEWFQVDLGTLRTVGSVTLVWEKANAKAYTIQTKAAESDPWTTQVTRNS